MKTLLRCLSPLVILVFFGVLLKLLVNDPTPEGQAACYLLLQAMMTGLIWYLFWLDSVLNRRRIGHEDR